MHWFLIVIIVIAIISFQFWVYRRTIEKIEPFKKVFKEDFKEKWKVVEKDGFSQIIPLTILQYENALKANEQSKKQKESERIVLKRKLSGLEAGNQEYSDKLIEINRVDSELRKIDESIRTEKDALDKLKESPSSNPTLNNIVCSINTYLEKNKGGSSDFHLMKDIVDRNCDALEDEIQSQLPMPLYAGLGGTMSGIIVGVGYLWLSGGLKNLLSATGSADAKGIEALLGGVALAMISSICGIILTTLGSWKSKEALAEVEKGKQNFLSWIQQELLPKLKTGVDGEVGKIVDSIKDFSGNTKKLDKTLAEINETVEGMSGMLKTLKQLNLVQMGTINIQVYDKLKGCTEEIGKLGIYLENVNGYLAKINQLSEQLSEADNRIKAFEEVAEYFKRERSTFEQMQSVVSQSIGQSDADLKEAVRKFKESTANEYQSLIQYNEQKVADFKKAADLQNQILDKHLNEKIAQIDSITDEIKKLAPIKDAIGNFEKATKEQNRKIDDLSASIRELAHAKAEGRPMTIEHKSLFPRWIKWPAIIGGIIVVISCLFFMVLKVLPYWGVTI